MTSADTLFPAADGSGVQARRIRDSAASTRDSVSTPGKARRGPFRPDVWLNTRQRNAARLRVFYFRALDIVGAGATTIVAVAHLVHSDPLSARLIELTPKAKSPRERFKDALIEAMRAECDDARWNALLARARLLHDHQEVTHG